MSRIQALLLVLGAISLAIITGQAAARERASLGASAKITHSATAIHGLYAEDVNQPCPNPLPDPCLLAKVDAAKAPQDLFRLQNVKSTYDSGDTLQLEIVSTASINSSCLLRNSEFAISISGERTSRAQFVARSNDKLTYTAQVHAPGNYQISANLRIFNYPSVACDVYALMAKDRIIDKAIVGGETAFSVSERKGEQNGARRTCGFGDVFDTRGEWSVLPLQRTDQGLYHKSQTCDLPTLPTPGEAFDRAKAAGIRWIRFLGDSNTRYLYDVMPFLQPTWDTPMRAFSRLHPYDLQSRCAVVHDPSGKLERNARQTVQFCRIGRGDPQQDIVVSWNWFTPKHDPPLSAYFNDEPNVYWSNATLASTLSAAPDFVPAHSSASEGGTAAEIFADRPDLLALRGGDRIVLSYGSHAMTHTRMDVGPYADAVEGATRALYELEKADPGGPQRRLSLALTTPKTCRKWPIAPVISPDLFKLCHSENFRDKNFALLHELADRGLVEEDGASISPSHTLNPTARAPFDILDFWHTAESVEDHMSDKVHFSAGTYRVHAQIVLASILSPSVI